MDKGQSFYDKFWFCAGCRSWVKKNEAAFRESPSGYQIAYCPVCNHRLRQNPKKSKILERRRFDLEETEKKG